MNTMPALTLCLITLIAALPARANLFTNGTFDVDAAGWTPDPVGHSGHDPFAGNPPGSFRLNSFGEDWNDPYIEQTVSGLTPGDSYRVSWELALHVDVGGPTTNTPSFGVFLDGHPIHLGAQLTGPFVADAVTFVATNSAHTLRFAGELDSRTPGVAGTTDVSYYIDNIVLEQGAQFIGPCPYLCSYNSPFLALNCVNFQLENFESPALTVTGVTISTGERIGPGGLTDSVDCDDGSLDGSGQNGGSWFYADSAITFTFNPAVLGGLPTHAGVVWTDGTGPGSFVAFDENGLPLGTNGPVALGDGSFFGTTEDDRFFGVVYLGGISAIQIINGGGVEIDHLQFGRCTGVITEPCPTNPVVNIACSLVPGVETNLVGQIHTVTSTVTSNGVPVPGVNVTFNVTGANGTIQTNITTAGNGQAAFSYTGLNAGTDNILAAGSVGAQEFACDAVKVWLSAPPTNLPPTALCRNITTNANANCQAAVPASAVDNGSFDPDGTIVARQLNPPGPYPKGVTAVTLTVTDNNGASDSCAATITVLDTTPPTITCPGNIITNVPAGVTNAVVTFGAPTVTDNCPAAMASCSPPSGSIFPLGVTTVTCTAVDTAGNTNACSFTVTVSSVCDCPDLTGTWSNLVQTCKFKNEVPACKVKGTLLVSNLGCVAAPTTFIRYYLSDDAVFDAGDTFLKQVATGTIKLDKPKKRTLSAKLPVGVNGSGKYILAVLDADQTLAECNENNNVVVFGPVP